jgi:hypothetical protein
VKNALERAPDGICCRWFVHDMHPSIDRVAARVHELRGYPYNMDIRTETCDLHPGREPLQHHDKYRLVTDGRWF